MEAYKDFVIDIYEEAEEESLSNIVQDFDERRRYDIGHNVNSYGKYVSLSRRHEFKVDRLTQNMVREMGEKIKILNQKYSGKSYEYAIYDELSERDRMFSSEEKIANYYPITEMIIYVTNFGIEIINNNSGTEDIWENTSVDPEWVIMFSMHCNYSKAEDYYAPHQLIEKDKEEDKHLSRRERGRKKVKKPKQKGTTRGNIIGGVGSMLVTLDLIRDGNRYDELVEFGKELGVQSNMTIKQIIQQRPSQIPVKLLNITRVKPKILTDALERYSEKNLMNLVKIISDKMMLPWPVIDKWQSRILTEEDYRNFLEMFLQYYSNKGGLIYFVNQNFKLIEEDIFFQEDVIKDNISNYRGKLEIVYKTFDELYEDIRMKIITNISDDNYEKEIEREGERDLLPVPPRSELRLRSHGYDPIPGSENDGKVIKLAEIAMYEKIHKNFENKVENDDSSEKEYDKKRIYKGYNEEDYDEDNEREEREEDYDEEEEYRS